MVDFAIIAVLVIVPVVWLVSEFKSNRAWRISLGVAAISLGWLAFISAEKRLITSFSFHTGAMLQLQDALEKPNSDLALRAVREYNEGTDDFHPALRMLDVLADTKSPEEPR